MTLIHHTLAFLSNIHKIPTPNTISPHLQIIEILNHPLTPHILINIYMPSHLMDLALIATIKDIVQTTITSKQIWSPPKPLDYDWQQFTLSQQLMYIPTNTTYTRQEGEHYTTNSLIDGFYIKHPHIHLYTSTTILSLSLNSDHFPVSLYILPNTIIARTSPPKPPPTPRIPNVVPSQKLHEFHTT